MQGEQLIKAYLREALTKAGIEFGMVLGFKGEDAMVYICKNVERVSALHGLALLGLLEAAKTGILAELEKARKEADKNADTE